jgi:hypothetical protein
MDQPQLTSDEKRLASVRPIDAIKAVKSRCGCSLFEAKQAVDAVRFGTTSLDETRSAALEEAAKICDEQAAIWRTSESTYRNRDNDVETAERCSIRACELEEAAAAIRAKAKDGA